MGSKSRWSVLHVLLNESKSFWLRHVEISSVISSGSERKWDIFKIWGNFSASQHWQSIFHLYILSYLAILIRIGFPQRSDRLQQACTKKLSLRIYKSDPGEAPRKHTTRLSEKKTVSFGVTCCHVLGVLWQKQGGVRRRRWCFIILG